MVYPYHHVRYVFVNPYGYWPCDYRYARYHWYGYYPYQWYGHNPVPYKQTGDTYNYYYYGQDGSSHGVDENVLREAYSQAQPPAEATLADELFEDAVNAFEQGSYEEAASIFARAIQQAPDDKVMPFAYSQAYFGAGRYSEAAASLRQALTNVDVEAEGVFYPRGLYEDDETLFRQIDALAARVQQDTRNTDLQLLLGYQLIGIGDYDDSLEPLNQAVYDTVNGPHAIELISLVEKIQNDQR